MRRMFGLVLVTALLFGVTAAFAEEPVAAPEILPGVAPLEDRELAAISGKGVLPSVGVQTARVILWDEEPARPGVISIHSATGVGANQMSTVTANGR